MPSLSLSNVFRRKVRTAISICAVAAGVALLLLLVGMTKGTLNEVVHRMQNTDADAIVHARGYNPVIDFEAALDERLAGKIQLQVPGVSRVIPVAVQHLILANRSNNVFGVRASDFDRLAHGRRILLGRLYRDGEMEMVVDSHAAREAALGLGDLVRVRDRDFTVVGVVEEGVPVRYLTSLAALQDVSQASGRVTFFYLKITDPDRISDVARRVEELFPSVKTLLLGNYYAALAGTFTGMQQVIVGVSAICSVIAFLVILLTTYTSVLERTREIGILKALGASNSFILRQIVNESLIICSLGVLLGIGLSFAARPLLVAGLKFVTVELPLFRIVWVSFLGLGAGVVGALYPGYLAARLDPVQAISYE